MPPRKGQSHSDFIVPIPPQSKSQLQSDVTTSARPHSRQHNRTSNSNQQQLQTQQLAGTRNSNVPSHFLRISPRSNFNPSNQYQSYIIPPLNSHNPPDCQDLQVPSKQAQKSTENGIQAIDEGRKSHLVMTSEGEDITILPFSTLTGSKKSQQSNPTENDTSSQTTLRAVQQKIMEETAFFAKLTQYLNHTSTNKTGLEDSVDSELPHNRDSSEPDTKISVSNISDQLNSLHEGLMGLLAKIPEFILHEFQKSNRKSLNSSSLQFTRAIQSMCSELLAKFSLPTPNLSAKSASNRAGNGFHEEISQDKKEQVNPISCLHVEDRIHTLVDEFSHDFSVDCISTLNSVIDSLNSHVRAVQETQPQGNESQRKPPPLMERKRKIEELGDEELIKNQMNRAELVPTLQPIETSIRKPKPMGTKTDSLMMKNTLEEASLEPKNSQLSLVKKADGKQHNIKCESQHEGETKTENPLILHPEQRKRRKLTHSSLPTNLNTSMEDISLPTFAEWDANLDELSRLRQEIPNFPPEIATMSSFPPLPLFVPSKGKNSSSSKQPGKSPINS